MSNVGCEMWDSGLMLDGFDEMEDLLLFDVGCSEDLFSDVGCLMSVVGWLR